MSSSPRGLTVSVIIPTRNRRDRLGAAIASALSQTRPPLEVIVIDDASTDGTGAWLGELARTEPRLRPVLNAVAEGGSEARNAGLRIAAGDAVAFLDDDDEWMPMKLERQTALLEQTGVEAATCWSTVDFGYTRAAFTVPPAPSLEGLLERNTCGSASLCMTTTAAARAIGGFDASLASAQDWDFWIRLRQRGPIGVVPESLVRYHAHRGPKITAGAVSAYRGVRTVLRKHRGAMSPTARRRVLAVAAYHRSMFAASRSARLRWLTRAARWRGPGATRLVMSSAPRILFPEPVLSRLVEGYVHVRTRLAVLTGSTP